MSQDKPENKLNFAFLRTLYESVAQNRGKKAAIGYVTLKTNPNNYQALFRQEDVYKLYRRYLKVPPEKEVKATMPWYNVMRFLPYFEHSENGVKSEHELGLAMARAGFDTNVVERICQRADTELLFKYLQARCSCKVNWHRFGWILLGWGKEEVRDKVLQGFYSLDF